MSKEEDAGFQKVRAALIAPCPPKVARKRSKSIIRIDPDVEQEMQSNTRTIPGIITMRGCAYAGCKGVVLGPTRDVLSITHGPIGCGFYSWLTRRNQTRPESASAANYIPYSSSTVKIHISL